MEQSITSYFIYNIAYYFVVYGGLIACIGLLLLIIWPQYGLFITFIKTKVNEVMKVTKTQPTKSTEVPQVIFYNEPYVDLIRDVELQPGYLEQDNIFIPVWNVFVIYVENSLDVTADCIATFTNEKDANDFHQIIVRTVCHYKYNKRNDRINDNNTI